MEHEDHQYCEVCGVELAYRYSAVCPECAAEEQALCEWYERHLHAFLHTVNARHLLEG